MYIEQKGPFLSACILIIIIGIFYKNALKTIIYIDIVNFIFHQNVVNSLNNFVCFSFIFFFCHALTRANLYVFIILSQFLTCRQNRGRFLKLFDTDSLLFYRFFCFCIFSSFCTFFLFAL